MKQKNYTVILTIALLSSPFLTLYGQGARCAGEYKASPALQYVNKNNFMIEN